jgi:protein ImuB
LSAGAIADRVRWQLDGWLNGSSATAARPTAGVALLELVPDEVIAATGRQLGFWGGTAGADERAVRAVARISGLLGPDAVTVPEWRGGRAPAEQVVLVPAGAVDLAEARPNAQPDTPRPGHHVAPWPGRLPSPDPAALATTGVEVLAVDGTPVGVTGRGAITAEPARLVLDGRPVEIAAWAGPWPAEERWWDASRSSRRARLQVVDAGGTARLLCREGSRWWVEAVYD